MSQIALAPGQIQNRFLNPAIVYKSLNGPRPAYITDVLEKYIPIRHLSSAESDPFTVSRTRSKDDEALRCSQLE